MSKKFITKIRCGKCGKIFEAKLIMDSKKLYYCSRRIVHKEGKMAKIYFAPGEVLCLDGLLCNECAAEHYRDLKGE